MTLVKDFKPNTYYKWKELKGIFCLNKDNDVQFLSGFNGNIVNVEPQDGAEFSEVTETDVNLIPLVDKWEGYKSYE